MSIYSSPTFGKVPSPWSTRLQAPSLELSTNNIALFVNNPGESLVAPLSWGDDLGIAAYNPLPQLLVLGAWIATSPPGNGTPPDVLLTDALGGIINVYIVAGNMETGLCPFGPGAYIIAITDQDFTTVFAQEALTASANTVVTIGASYYAGAPAGLIWTGIPFAQIPASGATGYLLPTTGYVPGTLLGTQAIQVSAPIYPFGCPNGEAPFGVFTAPVDGGSYPIAIAGPDGLFPWALGTLLDLGPE